jgi:hypothetical protein
MSPKRRRVPQDPMRRLVRGILSLLLGTLATWLAGKITDLILGTEKPECEESE